MTWYLYRPQAAVNIAGVPVASGAGQIYAIEDTTFATPLVVRDAVSHTVIPTVPIASYLTAAFEVEDHQEVYWRAGTAPAVSLISAQGMRDATTTAQLAAEQARDAAAASAVDVAIYRDEAIGARDDALGARTGAETARAGAQLAQDGAEAALATIGSTLDTWAIDTSDEAVAALFGTASTTRDVVGAAFVSGGIVMAGIAGVVGNGSTNDTAAIQAIINAAPKGGTVYVSPPANGQDSYLITGTLTVTTNNLRIVGPGRDVYAVNLKKASGTTPILEVKAPGFVMEGIGFLGNGTTNGSGATVPGVVLYGDTDGNIDSAIRANFQYLSVPARTRGRNAKFDGSMFTSCLRGVVIDGKDATYHTGPNADQNRGNTIHDCRFHNIGAASTDAAIEITATAKVLHALIADCYFDSAGLGAHVRAVGTSTSAHEKITCRDNKHTECSAEPYDFTYVNNSTIEGADVAGYAVGNPATYHAVKLNNCDTIVVSDLTAIQVSGSGIYARNTARLHVRDSVLRVMGFGTGGTGHGMDVDSTNSACRFDRVNVISADGWGFIGDPASSVMTDCDFTSCALGRINSTTIVNRSASGLNTFVENAGGRKRDEASKTYELTADVPLDVATVLSAHAYTSFEVEVRVVGRSATGNLAARYVRYVRPENGVPAYTTPLADYAVGCTVAFSASGTTGVKVTVTATGSSSYYATVHVVARSGGGAGLTNARGVTVAML